VLQIIAMPMTFVQPGGSRCADVLFRRPPDVIIRTTLDVVPGRWCMAPGPPSVDSCGTGRVSVARGGMIVR
jgi:hypothetical protein